MLIKWINCENIMKEASHKKLPIVLHDSLYMKCPEEAKLYSQKVDQSCLWLVSWKEISDR